MARMNWEGAARRAKTGPPRWKPRPEDLEPKKKRKKARGITNKQAQYLASLQRRLGEPYKGNGLTMQQASMLIADCQRRLGG
jgi:hypothetical protein